MDESHVEQPAWVARLQERLHKQVLTYVAETECHEPDHDEWQADRNREEQMLEDLGIHTL